jgi:hypothetical protein
VVETVKLCAGAGADVLLFDKLKSDGGGELTRTGGNGGFGGDEIRVATDCDRSNGAGDADDADAGDGGGTQNAAESTDGAAVGGCCATKPV